ncbi:MAG: response regulator [Spirochaetaceae bacterium]
MIEQSTILIVDDTPQNIDILFETLGDTYSIMVATNGFDALESASEQLPDLILLDIMMPGMDGFEVCEKLKSNVKTKDIPVVFLTAMGELKDKTKGFKLGAVDFITKPFEILEVIARVETHLSLKMAKDLLKNQNSVLDKLVKKRTLELMKTQDVTIRMAASLAETRDNDTGNHILRTQNYVSVIANRLFKDSIYSADLNEDKIDLMVKSAPLHDIGKIGVADKILLKPGKLTDLEFTEMKRHAEYGKSALLKAEGELDGNSFLHYAKEIAFSHHEKWDGSGYPMGLSGTNIPLSGRIMAVADVYDALISKRVYKPAFSHTKACELIESNPNTHFDPVIIKCFKEVKEEFRQIALEFCESEEQKNTLLN